MIHARLALVSACLFGSAILGACTPSETGGGTGGHSSTGGVGTGSGGAVSSSGGAGTASGGSGPASGGNTGVGSGGSGTATGGAPSSTGGTPSMGGAMGTGGASATGGRAATGGGGATGTGGAGGRAATGGAAGTGSGGAGTGGAGGSGPVTNACDGTPSNAYFLDSAAGNDSGDGMTAATAWKTLAKINAVTLQPGNKVCLKAGSTWTGSLRPKGSGSAAAPITVDQYGSGAKPAIAGGTSDTDVVYLLNQQYWELNNLDVSNKKSSLGDVRGISVNGQNGGTLNHIVIRNCRVHDVTGEVNWIGGDVADNQTGVTFQTGWDASKRTGGIVFDVQEGSGTAVKTKFNDVLIENNTVSDNSFAGISIKQLDGTVHWGTRSSASSTTWTPHTNVIIRGNYISQLNTNYGCNAIYLTNVQMGLIERNVTNGAGTSAVELYYTDSITVQHNETFGTKVKAGGADSNGIDSDKATTKTIIQYNYIHDNGDGILLCQFSFGDVIVRYNILQNNNRYQIYLHSDASAKADIYNNTVYNNKTNQGVAYGYGDSLKATYNMRNNIFVAAAGNGVLTTSSTITHMNNLYSGSSIMVPAGDSAAIKADPKLAAPGMGTSGSASGPAFGSLDGYKLMAGSPAINAGVSITNNGGADFWGGSLYVGTADVGAYESR